MTKWEYISIETQSNLMIAINGQEVRDPKREPPIHDYLNRLGSQGWELIGFTSFNSHSSSFQYILKRPKA